MRRAILTGLVAVGCALAATAAARAEVTAVNLVLESETGKRSYEVPAGKVLIVEHIVFSWYWDVQGHTKKVLLGVKGEDASYQPAEFVSQSDRMIFDPPMRLVGGNVIYISDLSPSAECFLIGLLVDTADLYAALPSEITDFQVAAQTLSGSLRLDTPRPARVRLEQTTNLLRDTWEPIDSAGIESTADTRLRTFALDVPTNSPHLFVRGRARSRTALP